MNNKEEIKKSINSSYTADIDFSIGSNVEIETDMPIDYIEITYPSWSDLELHLDLDGDYEIVPQDTKKKT